MFKPSFRDRFLGFCSWNLRPFCLSVVGGFCSERNVRFLTVQFCRFYQFSCCRFTSSSIFLFIQGFMVFQWSPYPRVSIPFSVFHEIIKWHKHLYPNNRCYKSPRLENTENNPCVGIKNERAFESWNECRLMYFAPWKTNFEEKKFCIFQIKSLHFYHFS